MSSDHPPLMRRRRSIDVRNAQIQRERVYLRQCVDENWFMELSTLPVQPVLLTTETEVRGECLRLGSEYLRLRYNRKTKHDEQGQGEEKVPHPQTGAGLALLGRVYKQISGDEPHLATYRFPQEVAVHTCESTQGRGHPSAESDGDDEAGEAGDATEALQLYDVVRLTRDVVAAVDSEITRWQDIREHSRPAFFGDIVVYADQGRRTSMEDKHVVISDLNALFGLDEYPYQAFFAIYDGHGGVEAAEYARNHLHVNVVYSEHFATDPEQALRAAFAQTDIDFLAHARRENLTSGCTCIVALVRGDTLYTAWLGDSQAMLCRDNTPVPDICRPHKPERDDEKSRIEELGGVVVWYGAWRVNGVLSVARAIGDSQLKKYVTSECDVSATRIVGGEEFLLLACDGLWDVLEAEQVVAFVANHLEEGKDTSETAKALVKHAIRLGSGDNISLIVVFFKDKQRAVRSRQRELALQRKAASETAAQGSTDSNAPTSSS